MGTIHKRLTGLAKFYQHGQEGGSEAECGGVFNPVAGASRPRLTQYEKANFLSAEEEAALLGAIRREPTPTGKRDYALFLTLLSTGLRAGEGRKWQWGALEVEEGKIRIKLERGGRIEMAEAREAVWEAIQVYLEASGRRAEIKPGDYVFAPGKEPLGRAAGGRGPTTAPPGFEARVERQVPARAGVAGGAGHPIRGVRQRDREAEGGDATGADRESRRLNS